MLLFSKLSEFLLNLVEISLSESLAVVQIRVSVSKLLQGILMSLSQRGSLLTFYLFSPICHRLTRVSLWHVTTNLLELCESNIASRTLVFFVAIWWIMVILLSYFSDNFFYLLQRIRLNFFFDLIYRYYLLHTCNLRLLNRSWGWHDQWASWALDHYAHRTSFWSGWYLLCGISWWLIQRAWSHRNNFWSLALLKLAEQL